MGSILVGLWFFLFGLFGLVQVQQSQFILAILALIVGLLVMSGHWTDKWWPGPVK